MFDMRIAPLDDLVGQGRAMTSLFAHAQSLRAPDLKEKLAESEKLIQEISQTWEDKLRKTEQVHKVGCVVWS